MANLTTHKEIKRIVNRYRKRIGIDPSYILHINILEEDHWPTKLGGAGAWCEEASTHPVYTINFRRSYLSELRNNPRQIIRLVVHELLHIPIGRTFQFLKRNYDYDKDGKIEEELVMQLARAIVPAKEDQ